MSAQKRVKSCNYNCVLHTTQYIFHTSNAPVLRMLYHVKSQGPKLGSLLTPLQLFYNLAEVWCMWNVLEEPYVYNFK